MFQGKKSLQELAAELDAQQARKRDMVVDTRSIEVSEDVSQLSVDGEAFAINDLTHRQIGQHLKVRADFYDRLRGDHPDLLAHNLNTLLHREPADRMLRTFVEPTGLVAVTPGFTPAVGRTRAMLSNRYHRIDHSQVLGTALSAMQSIDTELSIASCEVTERKLYLKVVFPKIVGEVKVGDEVQSGFVITNSEVGQGAYQVAPFIHRLICLNGMVMNKLGNRRNHVGAKLDAGDLATELYQDDTKAADDNAIMLKMRDIIMSCATPEGFAKLVALMAEAAGDRITGDPVKAVEVLSQMAGFNATESSGVMRHLIEGGDLSRWGMLNAVTRSAHDMGVVTTYDRATELEELGGRILDLPRSDWSRISEAA